MKSSERRSILARIVGLPARDLMNGLERALDGRLSRFFVVAIGLLVGWWIYVPLHELLHAAGCVVTGGSVSRLEIDPLYGGGILAHVFPFVVAGGHYAGRLSGFDTHGSDLVYLATDLAPFLLAFFPGVWLMRKAARRERPLLFGASLPFALAPFLSLTGDAYEMGSILVTRIPWWSGAALVKELRGDDLFLIAARVFSDPSASACCGLALGALLGLVWAFLWYALAAWLASRFGQGALARKASA